MCTLVPSADAWLHDWPSVMHSFLDLRGMFDLMLVCAV